MTNEENKGAAFHIGEWVSGLPNDVAGRLFGSYAGPGALPGYAKIIVEGNPNYPLVLVDSLRHEPAEQKARFYGEQPKVLPKTLPVGVKSQGGREALAEATLISNGVYIGRWTDTRGGEQECVLADCLDWSTVPIQDDPPPSRASAEEVAHCYDCPCARCLRPSKPPEPVRSPNRVSTGYQDYDKPRELAICAEMTARNEKRLSAMTLRERRKSEALRMMDRKEPAKYPHWPESWLTPGWES